MTENLIKWNNLSYDKKSGEPTPYPYCTCKPNPDLNNESLEEVDRKYFSCDHSWSCKCKTVEVTYRCRYCGSEVVH